MPRPTAGGHFNAPPAPFTPTRLTSSSPGGAAAAHGLLLPFACTPSTSQKAPGEGKTGPEFSVTATTWCVLAFNG